MTFPEEDREFYTISWNKSSAEFLRMLRHFVSLPPHATKYTLSLNNVRNTVLAMCRPMAEISSTLEINIAEIAAAYKQIFDLGKGIQHLFEKLQIPVVDLVASPLSKPRTVCTGAACTDVIMIGRQKKVDYRTTCCSSCDVVIESNQLGNEVMLHCQAMDRDTGMCRTCGCKWDVHMCITYETTRVVKKTVSREGREKLRNENSALEAFKLYKEKLKKSAVELKKEKERLDRAMNCCATFLRRNAIASYNDSLLKYLEYCRENGIDKRDDDLQTLYVDLSNAAEDVILHSPDDFLLEPEKVNDLLKGLFSLGHVGPMFKNIMDVIAVSDAQSVTSEEKELIVNERSTVCTSLLHT